MSLVFSPKWTFFSHNIKLYWIINFINIYLRMDLHKHLRHRLEMNQMLVRNRLVEQTHLIWRHTANWNLATTKKLHQLNENIIYFLIRSCDANVELTGPLFWIFLFMFVYVFTMPCYHFWWLLWTHALWNFSPTFPTHSFIGLFIVTLIHERQSRNQKENAYIWA